MSHFATSGRIRKRASATNTKHVLKTNELSCKSSQTTPRFPHTFTHPFWHPFKPHLLDLFGSKRVIVGALGCLWRGLWEPWGSFGGPWGSFWEPLGTSGGVSGSLGGPLGVPGGSLGRLLGPFWTSQGPPGSSWGGFWVGKFMMRKKRKKRQQGDWLGG